VVKITISQVSKKEFLATKETLCLTCGKFYDGPRLLCAYFAIKDSEKGIRAVGADALKTEIMYSRKKSGEKYPVFTYKILACPHYKFKNVLKRGE